MKCYQWCQVVEYYFPSLASGKKLKCAIRWRQLANWSYNLEAAVTQDQSGRGKCAGSYGSLRRKDGLPLRVSHLCDHQTEWWFTQIPSDDRISEKLGETDHLPSVPVCCHELAPQVEALSRTGKKLRFMQGLMLWCMIKRGSKLRIVKSVNAKKTNFRRTIEGKGKGNGTKRITVTAAEDCSKMCHWFCVFGSRALGLGSGWSPA